MSHIFISYRRDDRGYAAGRLYDWVSDHFGDLIESLERTLVAAGSRSQSLDELSAAVDTMR